MSELKPCPFCGSENIDAKGWASNSGETGPSCDDCGCTAETVDEWNNRPIELELESELSASQAREAELREKLRIAEARILELQSKQ